MKALAIIKYVFFLIGLAMLVGAFFLYQNTNNFLAEAVKAEGVVVELVPQRSDGSVTYSAMVHFTDAAGKEIEFVTSHSSNPPSYSVGEKVEVLYRPDQPHKARIDGFFSLRLGELIVGVLGLIFFLIGGGMLLAGLLKGRKKKYLHQHGTPIDATFQKVELDTSFKVNNAHSYRITAAWQNPKTSDLHLFASEHIWYDPSGYIESETIRVYIDPNNPKKYHVDISFLPKLVR